MAKMEKLTVIPGKCVKQQRLPHSVMGYKVWCNHCEIKFGHIFKKQSQTGNNPNIYQQPNKQLYMPTQWSTHTTTEGREDGRTTQASTGMDLKTIRTGKHSDSIYTKFQEMLTDLLGIQGREVQRRGRGGIQRGTQEGNSEDNVPTVLKTLWCISPGAENYQAVKSIICPVYSIQIYFNIYNMFSLFYISIF